MEESNREKKHYVYQQLKKKKYFTWDCGHSLCFLPLFFCAYFLFLFWNALTIIIIKKSNIKLFGFYLGHVYSELVKKPFYCHLMVISLSFYFCTPKITYQWVVLLYNIMFGRNVVTLWMQEKCRYVQTCILFIYMCN